MARIEETFDGRDWYMIECDDPNCEQRFDDGEWYADEDDLLNDARIPTRIGIMHRMMEQEKEKAMSESEHEAQPVAAIIYGNGAELTGTAVTTSDGSVGIRIPDGSFGIVLNPDGSMPEGVESAGIRPEHPEGGLPLTDDMVYMAVTAMLREAVGLPLNEAADLYESWLNRMKHEAIVDWVDSLSTRESTRLHMKYLDRDGAGHLRKDGTHDSDRA